MVLDRAPLPLGERGPIPDLRRLFNAVMWRFRTSSPWRDLPIEYGPWSTAYDRRRTWARDGVFEQLLQTMIAEAAARGQADLGLVGVVSTAVCAHHHAAGMALDGELSAALEEAARQERGLCQRGKTPPTTIPATPLTSKVHLAADGRCRPLSFVMTAGQAGDSPQFRPGHRRAR
ncbi:transposase [Nonomuraea sp. NPDC049646]|uniref:transposase n=1 Tax=unclassified Nonomuraea TaxID=2593643 RepID=UPI003791DCE1